ncbi:MAG: hypothetical protein PHU77_00255 [Simplicispira sp.]|nr:hypothetical protein [Simplicispira sp.]
MTAANAFTVRSAPTIQFKTSQQARVLRAITHQPPQYNATPIAARTDGAVAALAIRNSQFEAQRRARRAWA